VERSKSGEKLCEGRGNVGADGYGVARLCRGGAGSRATKRTT